ncbi:hypothetical protein [Streptomyces flavofungini]|uniref:hypothetical protein n=1 Tax=Streptomyces flavofungini TaxID=68200 RepID=UPI0025AF87D3|nr:hypothetical protein [Streptomyces flavofungini]WJV46650.1 hypothetical protein QUY26_14630 [Streptomyces flavofungini]
MLAVALAVVLSGAPWAAAGGPTSVLLTSPESAETASLHREGKRYAELETLLGPTAEGKREQPPGLSLGATRQINVTWLVHDVRPWRVDRVYPEPSAAKDAAIWIHTSTDPETMTGYWHRSPDPSALRSLLKDLGLMGRPSERNHPGIRPSEAATPVPETPAPARAAAPDADGAEGGVGGAGGGGGSGGSGGSGAGDDSAWLWAIPSAAAGAAAGAALMYRLRRRGPGDEPPRQELLDA